MVIIAEQIRHIERLLEAALRVEMVGGGISEKGKQRSDRMKYDHVKKKSERREKAINISRTIKNIKLTIVATKNTKLR